MIWEQRYALEMIERGAEMLGAQIEFVCEMNPDVIRTVQIVIHMPGSQEALSGED